MDNIISKMKYELGDLKYQLMVSKEENRVMHLRNNEQAKKNEPDDFVRKDVYELMFDKATRQDNTIKHLLNENSKLKKNANSKMVFKLEKEVSELREFIKLQDNKITDMYEEKQKLTNRLKEHYFSNEKLQGHRYAFSNIPNDEEGNKFVEQMKLYFNYDSYDFRKRGQYLDNDKLSIGETWKTYSDGQPLSKSKCIRIYIDKKKGGK